MEAGRRLWWQQQLLLWGGMLQIIVLLCIAGFVANRVHKLKHADRSLQTLAERFNYGFNRLEQSRVATLLSGRES